MLDRLLLQRQRLGDLAVAHPPCHPPQDVLLAAGQALSSPPAAPQRLQPRALVDALLGMMLARLLAALLVAGCVPLSRRIEQPAAGTGQLSARLEIARKLH